MSYASLAGSIIGGSSRLGTDTTVWCPILAAAALVLFVLAAVSISREEEDETPPDADAA